MTMSRITITMRSSVIVKPPSAARRARRRRDRRAVAVELMRRLSAARLAGLSTLRGSSELLGGGEASLACVLCRVQRFVAALEHARGAVVRLQVGHSGGDADAAGEGDRRRLDRPLDPPDELPRLDDLELGDDHRELVAAAPARDVGRADDLPDAVRD